MISILIDFSLLGLLVLTALAVVFIHDLFAAVMVFGIYSLVCAAFFISLSAPDVALTEAAIGAGIAPMLMLGTLALITDRKRKTSHIEKPASRGIWLPLLVVTATGAALIYGTLDMPHFADAAAPIHHHVAPRYIEDGPSETGVPNMVTAVLASYRGYDTLGEVFVIFTAGIGVLALLGLWGAGQNKPQGKISLQHHTVLRVITKAMIPLILLYALYVQFHGDYSPGGGFQAGVLFAAAFILYAIIFGLQQVYKIITPGLLRIMMALGVLLYGGTGLACLALGGQYLNYNVLEHDPVHGQHLGILLVELGVGINVAIVMMAIFFSFTGHDNAPQGKGR